MAQQALKKQKEGNAPLESLSSILESDMAAVNRLILERMDSHVPLIKQLATYLIASGGKRVRPLLTLASTMLHDGDMTRAHLLAACVEFIHTATLLHDDVVDESTQRRGQDSANIVFGNQASVLVGDFLFSRSFQLMVQDGSLEVLRILSEASATIAEGEVLQLAQAGNINMGMETYIKIVNGKTAALFAAACEVGPVVADAGKDKQDAMREFGTNLGIAFQIADDVLDYSAAQAKLGKTIGDDFREGKLTAPVFFALEKATPEEQKFWKRVMQDNNQTDADLNTALEIFEKYNCLEQGMTLAQSYADKARTSLHTYPDNDICNQLLGLLEFIVNRDY